MDLVRLICHNISVRYDSGNVLASYSLGETIQKMFQFQKNSKFSNFPKFKLVYIVLLFGRPPLFTLFISGI